MAGGWLFTTKWPTRVFSKQKFSPLRGILPLFLKLTLFFSRLQALLIIYKLRGEVGDQLFPGSGLLGGHIMSVLVVRVMRQVASFPFSLPGHLHRERTGLPRMIGILHFWRLYLQAIGVRTALIIYANGIFSLCRCVSHHLCTFSLVSFSRLFCKTGWLLIQQLFPLLSSLPWSPVVGSDWKEQNHAFLAFYRD